MNSRQYALGQLETPAEVADLLSGLAIGRPTDRVLDPSCGEGALLERAAAWLEWLDPAASRRSSGSLQGIEGDAEAASLAQRRVPRALVSNQNFLTLSAADLSVFDAIIGNPPYTPAEYIGWQKEESPRQLSMFPGAEPETQAGKTPLIAQHLAATLSGRAGLHAYFLVHSTEFLREGGRLAFVVPNGWLDVAYGAELKQYLLDHYRILAIIESAVERWFAEMWINTCIVALEKCTSLARRQSNLVRLARLKQPLGQLLPYSVLSPQRFVAVERLAGRLLPGRAIANEEADVHVKEQRTLHAERKWGMSLRAPLVFRHYRDHLSLAPLKSWAGIQRGYTTGANEFFYLTADVVEQWGLEKRFRKPLLKSLRGIDRLTIGPEATHLEVLLIPPEATLEKTAAVEYVKWGESQGFHLRQTCRYRQPWYSLQPQAFAPLVMPKGIWQRHFAPLLSAETAVDQQLYQINVSPYMPLPAVAALLNSAWFALQVELRGRVSFGKGLLWLAAYELEEVQLPDPRQFSKEQAARLEEAWQQLAGRTLDDGLAELAAPDRQALDEAVFDIMGFSERERQETVDSLAERLASRIQRAG